MKNNFGHSWRAYLIYIFLAISLFILVFRMVSLKYIEGDFLTSKGKEYARDFQGQSRQFVGVYWIEIIFLLPCQSISMIYML